MFAGRHAYSYVNSLSSAMMAYLVAGSEKHLRAARNAFAMLDEQSYATGGWGPDEQLRAPGSDDVYASLTNSHHSFETPCGSYAHFKLTRYLLRVTRDARYGDSMERTDVQHGAGREAAQDNGEAFYYSDYNFDGKRVYKEPAGLAARARCPRSRPTTAFRPTSTMAAMSLSIYTFRRRCGGRGPMARSR